MARGFGSTLGTNNSDSIVLASIAFTATFSFSFWILRNGAGGNSAGRVYDNNAASSAFSFFNSGSNYAIRIPYTGGFGFAEWLIVQPSSGVWHHIVITHDASNTSNKPTVYIDGVSVTVSTGSQTPGGAYANASHTFYLGNNSTVGRNWDGDIAEFAIWGVVLDAAEAKALGSGIAPNLIRFASLQEYIPMIRDNTGVIRSAPTVSGTAVQPHPPVRYDDPPQNRWLGSAAVGATFSAALMSASAQSFTASIAAGATFSAALSSATAAMRVADVVGGAALQAALMAASATLLDASEVGGATMGAEAMSATALLLDAIALGGAVWSSELLAATGSMPDAGMSGTEVGEFAAEVMSAVASLADADITAGAQLTAQLLTAQAQMLNADAGAGALFSAALLLATARLQDAQMSAGSTLLAVTMAASAQANAGTMTGGAQFVAALASATARAYDATMHASGVGDATFDAQTMTATARLLAAALITVAVNWISCFEDGEEPKRVVWPAVRKSNSAPAPEYPRELPAILRQPDTFNDWEL